MFRYEVRLIAVHDAVILVLQREPWSGPSGQVWRTVADGRLSVFSPRYSCIREEMVCCLLFRYLN